MTETTNPSTPGTPAPPWVAGAQHHPQAGAAGGSQVAAEVPQEVAKAGAGRPSGLVLAGAGSLLAVLAFLGGTAVGHAWGGSGGAGQTQINGPGGGRFGQAPGQGFGQGTGPGTQQGQGTQQQPGTQGQGTDPGAQQGTVPGQTQTS